MTVVMLFLGGLAMLGFKAPVQSYWISYGHFLSDTPGATPGGAKYLMKIDAAGNILMPPQKVVPNSKQYVSPVLA
jgi:hypothetical protein